MKFEDHFSKFADEYSRFRPVHPTELFEYLNRVVPDHELAWDCGTGNGQAALALVKYFRQVVASDASAEQISHAFSHPRIDYRVEAAEKISLPDSCADLVTVAVAVHWFDLDIFYREVKRVLKPAGIVAVWMYHLPEQRSPIEKLINHYYAEILAGYWPEKFHFIDEQYQTLPFPFRELHPPPMVTRTEWNLKQLDGFLGSWSAAARLLEKEGPAPLEEFRDKLKEAWGDENQNYTMEWPIHIRVGIHK
jgi:ubiquinone/menaquinone biosynthesis C-methylase UbiE